MTDESDDPRLSHLDDGDTTQVSWRASNALLAPLFTDAFPMDRYPSIQTPNEAIERAVEQVVANARNGGQPADVFDQIMTIARAQGGVNPIIVMGDTAIYPTGDGALQLSTTHAGDVRHMEFDELDSDEFATLMRDIDEAALVDLLVDLVAMRPDLDFERGLFRFFEQSPVTLEEMFDHMLSTGDYDREEIEAALEQASTS